MSIVPQYWVVSFNTPTRSIIVSYSRPVAVALMANNYRQNSFLHRASKSLDSVLSNHDSVIDVFNCNVLKLKLIEVFAE